MPINIPKFFSKRESPAPGAGVVVNKSLNDFAFLPLPQGEGGGEGLDSISNPLTLTLSQGERGLVEGVLEPVDNEAVSALAFTRIPLQLIDPDPDNPRGSDGEEDMAELIESVRAYGVLQPILVRPLGMRFKIAAGERRYRASLVSEQGSIPAIVREMTDEQAEEIQLIENAQRKDPNPLLLAGRIQRMIERLRAAGEEKPGEAVAKKLGKHPTWISNVLYTVRTKPAVQALINRGLLRDLSRIRELDRFKGTQFDEAIARAEQLGKVPPAVIKPPRPRKASAVRSQTTAVAESPAISPCDSERAATSSAPPLFALSGRATVIRVLRATGFAATVAESIEAADDGRLSQLLTAMETWLSGAASA